MKILIFQLWILLGSLVHSQGQNCTGWFGSSCQYKCRCTSSCTVDGSCTPGGSCQPGWFGPACQYADLAYNVPVTVQSGGYLTSAFTDNNDVTCNPYNTSQSLTLTMDQGYHISWLRIYAHNTGSLSELMVQFRNGSTDVTASCRKIVTINDHTMDIFCELNVPVNQVVLTGEAVKSLCSLYISGGRNVALHQQVSHAQSSTYSNSPAAYGPQKAVDGDNSRDFNKSCACTDNSSNPFWYTNISRPATIYRYVLYNTIDTNQDGLQGFKLTMFDVQGIALYSYADTGTQPERIYTVVPDSATLTGTRVEIEETDKDKNLILCEVEIYGAIPSTAPAQPLSLPAGAIIGAVLGSVAVALVAAVVVCILWRRKKAKPSQLNADSRSAEVSGISNGNTHWTSSIELKRQSKTDSSTVYEQ